MRQFTNHRHVSVRFDGDPIVGVRWPHHHDPGDRQRTRAKGLDGDEVRRRGLRRGLTVLGYAFVFRVGMLASGGLLVAGGRPYATRRVEDALGVIDVPGLADVRIYQENRLIARTDARGRAIIPDLRAYEQNRIAIAPGASRSTRTCRATRS